MQRRIASHFRNWPPTIRPNISLAKESISPVSLSTCCRRAFHLRSKSLQDSVSNPHFQSEWKRSTSTKPTTIQKTDRSEKQQRQSNWSSTPSAAKKSNSSIASSESTKGSTRSEPSSTSVSSSSTSPPPVSPSPASSVRGRKVTSKSTNVTKPRLPPTKVPASQAEYKEYLAQILYLQKQPEPLDPVVYHGLLEYCFQRKNTDRGIRLLRGMYLEREIDQFLDKTTVTYLVAFNIKAGSVVTIYRRLQEARRYNLPVFEEFKDFASEFLNEEGEMEKARTVFRELEIANTKTNTDGFVKLLQAAIERDQPEEALRIVEGRLNLGHKISVFSTTTVLSGLLKAGLLEQALEFWSRVKSTFGTSGPPRSIYNTLLSGLSHDPSKFSLVKELWQHMIADQRGWQPDEVSFSSMLSGYFRARDITSALALWESMQEEPFNIKPTTMLYNSLFRGMFHNHKPMMVKEYFRNMVLNKVQMNADTCTVLIRGFVSVLDQEGVAEVAKEMKQHGQEADVGVYLAVADTLFSQGDSDSALKAIKTIMGQEQGHNELESPMYYSMIISGLMKCGQPHQAMDYYREMAQKEVPRTAHVYGAMIQGAFRNSLPELAEEMASLAVETLPTGLSSGSYSLLISGYVQLQDLDKAQGWFDKLQASPHARIHWTTYYVLLKAYVQNRHWSEAERFIETMHGNGFQLNVPRLNVLVQTVANVRLGIPIDQTMDRPSPRLKPMSR